MSKLTGAMSLYFFGFLVIFPDLNTLESYFNMIYTENIFSIHDNKSNYRNGRNASKLALGGLTKLPPELKDCFWLEELDISGNEILFIDDLVHLKNLRSLNLGANRIKNFNVLNSLENLKDLDISSNPPMNMDFLSGLKSLEKLSIRSNKLLDGNYISVLSKLKVLDLGRNEISNIAFISDLKQLNTLSLRYNNIANIDVLSGLHGLENLDLSFNKIVNIDSLAKLKNLKNVDLSTNKIKSISYYLVSNQNLELDYTDKKVHEKGRIFLNGNPIVEPPLKVISQGKAFTEAYLRDIDRKPLNECKVIIVGRGAVGKTSLQRCLTFLPFDKDEITTHGIRKIKWDNFIQAQNAKGYVKINFWDFGGQQIQQSLHQFFYSKKTVYILTLDERKEESPEDFLELIKMYGDDSPVIIVFNHKVDISQNVSIEYEEYPEIDSALRNKYKNIIASFGVCCAIKNDIGISNLRNYLKNFIPTLQHVKEEFPKSWLQIKEKLVSEVEKNYIHYEEYENICKEYKVNNIDIQKGLVEMLDSVGTITYFNREFLGNYYILNPDWLTVGAYEILLSTKTRIKKGKLNSEDLKEIFSTKLMFAYKRSEYEFLLSLLQSFDLCHRSERGDWLFPSSLQEKSKADLVLFLMDKYKLYVLSYSNSLPYSVIYRFIARNMRYSVTDDYWRNGILVQHPDSETLMYVEADTRQKEIRLWIKGKNIRDCWEFFRKDFREFSERFAFSEEIELSPKIRIKYQDLVECVQAGHKSWFIPGYGLIKVSHIIGNFESPLLNNLLDDKKGIVDDDNRKKVKLFISYAHIDNATKQKFEDPYLKLILNHFKGQVTTWSDKDTPPGADYNNTIKRELKKSQIFICFLTNSFMSSDYINSVEIKIAQELKNSGEMIIVPIYVERISSDFLPFKDLQFLPRKMMPLKKWPDENDAWIDIQQGLKEIIDDIILGNTYKYQ
ncbi:hypothetical protein Dfri01_09980 [Dyadobacter frigoris]|uniref:COR domain-containing protein n=1 Tax=Dyadobacter frigoris TaxID=2576211 RepID=UPI00249FB9B5|nr:COR domain-containing protein [Dyadobacter frigoris]GLU51537.1 hypothetical protein Dfri01_09980 [Dyadobacter frigoris]